MGCLAKALRRKDWLEKVSGEGVFCKIKRMVELLLFGGYFLAKARRRNVSG